MQVAVKIVQQTPQLIALTGALRDDIVVTVAEQPQIPRRRRWPSTVQIRVAQRRAGDRGRVDGIGLALGVFAATGLTHYLRRHPDDRFAAGEQRSFQPTRHVPAVFYRPAAPLVAVSPPHQLLMAAVAGATGSSATAVCVSLCGSIPMVTIRDPLAV